MKAARLI